MLFLGDHKLIFVPKNKSSDVNKNYINISNQQKFELLGRELVLNLPICKISYSLKNRYLILMLKPNYSGKKI